MQLLAPAIVAALATAIALPFVLQKSEEPPAAPGDPVAEALAQIPADANLLVRLPELDRMRQIYSRAQVLNPETAPADLSFPMLMGMWQDVDLFAMETDLPFLSFGFAKTIWQEPEVVYLVPARNVDRIRETLRSDMRMEPWTEHYVALLGRDIQLEPATASEGEPDAADLIAELGDGDFELVVDLGGPLRSELAGFVPYLGLARIGALQELAYFDLPQPLVRGIELVLEQLEGHSEDLLRSTRHLGLSFTLGDRTGEVELYATLEPGSELHREPTAPGALAALVPTLDLRAAAGLAVTGGALEWSTAALPGLRAAVDEAFQLPAPGSPARTASDDLMQDFLDGTLVLVELLAGLPGNASVSWTGIEEPASGELWVTGLDADGLRARIEGVLAGEPFARHGLGWSAPAEDGSRRIVVDVERLRAAATGAVLDVHELVAEVEAAVAGLPPLRFLDADHATGLALRTEPREPFAGAVHRRLQDLTASAEGGFLLFSELAALFEAEPFGSFEGVMGAGLTPEEKQELFDLRSTFALYGTHDGDRLRLGLVSDLQQAPRMNALIEKAGNFTPSPESAGMFDRNVLPILEQHCVRCHGAERQRSDLRLDSLEGVLAGSFWGLVVVPGQPDESLLVDAVRDPFSMGIHLPPVRVPQLTEAEVEAIYLWVQTLR